MDSNIESITIYVQYDNDIHTLKTHKNEYRSLMQLIYDQIITDDFGDCKGTGRCGTCLIEILNNPKIANQQFGNETATINKLDQIVKNSRLACQILIDNQINNLQCKIIKTESLGY
jgi:2Fe-2S ferredoxin